MKIHELKTWNPYFADVENGNKDFELRKNDRDFKVGDKLILMQYNHYSMVYTGKIITKKIKYILVGGQFGLEEGYVILGF